MKWIPAILLLLVAFAQRGKVEYYNRSNIVQTPQLGNSKYHPQSFSEEFFIPLLTSDKLNTIKVNLTVKTTKVMGAGNFTPKDGVITLSNISNHITVIIDTTHLNDRVITLQRDYIYWIVDVPPQTLINTPPEHTKEIGVGVVADVNDIKVYIIEGKPHMKLTVTGDSFYEHASTLPIFVSKISYKHDITGQVLIL
tara:strand:+ start:103 stop:690 length:588 start_codon:yes stop_codon:yes gene_type:complete